MRLSDLRIAEHLDHGGTVETVYSSVTVAQICEALLEQGAETVEAEPVDGYNKDWGVLTGEGRYLVFRIPDGGEL